MSNDCTIYPLKIWNLNPLINEIPQVHIRVKHEWKRNSSRWLQLWYCALRDSREPNTRSCLPLPIPSDPDWLCFRHECLLWGFPDSIHLWWVEGLFLRQQCKAAISQSLLSKLWNNRLLEYRDAAWLDRNCGWDFWFAIFMVWNWWGCVDFHSYESSLRGCCLFRLSWNCCLLRPRSIRPPQVVHPRWATFEVLRLEPCNGEACGLTSHLLH